jgi:hypothetical protein
LNSSCSLAAGSKAQVDFTANAPTSTGNFTFAVTTSKNGTAGTSNSISVSTAGPILTAASYASGANTTYTVNGVTVGSLTASGTTLILSAAATVGTETISFLNSGSGGAGYSVTVAPSGGTTFTDTVTNAAASGSMVTLSLGSALVNGDSLIITATGTNPAPNGSSQADHITVQPGNGTPETTNAIAFGGSVTGITVDPSTLVAGASAVYTVGFKASSAASAGGYIYLTENSGPTNFTTVSGIEVIDTTHNWHFVASGTILTNGSVTIPLTDAISAGDAISIILAGVTNPSSAGTVGDFTVATSGDPVAVNAPPYTIGANGSPGVIVTVNPNTSGAVATYTVSNVRASGTLAGGSGTIKLEAPTGTVFPNNAGFYNVSDSTTPSGSGTVISLTGGATNTVTFTVPNTINSGDVLSITVADVLNPSSASSADSITLVGSVTGPNPVPVTTTTTTTRPTTTTTKPKPKKPTVTNLTGKDNVIEHVAGIKVKCTVEACKGTITLTDVKTVVGSKKYSERAGKTNTLAVYLNKAGKAIVAVSKKHTITVTVTVTVSGGKTIQRKTTLVGVS